MRRHRVVLYNPQAVFYTMPLALVAVGSQLDPSRYDVEIIDGRLERDPIQAVVEATDGALCLGVTVLTGAPIRDALRVVRAVKRVHPRLPVVWGGWHPSLFPTETLKEPTIDIAVQGQGEQTFQEIVERLIDGAPLDGLPGTAFRVVDRIVQNPLRPLVDMNTFRPYDYRLIPVETYFRRKRRRQLDYISSIGCLYRCAFCADPFVYNRRWTALTPERVGDEVEWLWRRYRFTELAFQDETFFTHRHRVVAIAEEFLRRDLRFTWTATMRADQGARLSDDVWRLCVRSGLRRVMIGVESGDPILLAWMTKDITLEQVFDCAEKCVRHGVSAIFPFIVGFPGESDESVWATLRMVKRLRSMSPAFETPIFYYKPYPGSPIAEAVVRNGYRLPETLDAWADFDFIGSSGPWVRPDKYRLVERFKFYSRMAWSPRRWYRWPLQVLARWRCRHDRYGWPVEKRLVEWIKPPPRLS